MMRKPCNCISHNRPERQVIDDEVIDDLDNVDEAPSGWWIVPAAVIGLLIWLGITVAIWIAMLGVLK